MAHEGKPSDRKTGDQRRRGPVFPGYGGLTASDLALFTRAADDVQRTIRDLHLDSAVSAAEITRARWMPPDTVSRYLRELNRGIPVHVPRPIDTAKLFATVSDVLPRIDYRRLLGPSVVAAMRPADATSLVAGFSSAVRPLEAAPILERIVEDAVDAVETDLGGEPASFDELSEPELVDAVIVISAVVEAILNVVAYHANDGRIQLAALYLGVVVAMLAAAALAVKVCQSKP